MNRKLYLVGYDGSAREYMPSVAVKTLPETKTTRRHQSDYTRAFTSKSQAEKYLKHLEGTETGFCILTLGVVELVAEEEEENTNG